MRSAKRLSPRRVKPLERGLIRLGFLRSADRICLPLRLGLFRGLVPFSPGPLPPGTVNFGRSSKPSKTVMTDATAPRTGLMQSVWANPILLLVITTLIWSAHSIVGRLAVGQIGPMTLTCLRWAVALIPILIAARPSLRQDWPALRARWVYLAVMGAAGYTVFVALFYVAAHRTTALKRLGAPRRQSFRGSHRPAPWPPRSDGPARG